MSDAQSESRRARESVAGPPTSGVRDADPARGAASSTPDVGATHLALVVSDARRSIAFYEHYARMQLIHDRQEEGGSRVVWLSDLTRPFVLVLIEGDVDARLGGFCHLGVGCESRAEVDRRSADARREGFLAHGPIEGGDPVGYWAFLRDPDGHNLELSFGQQVGFAITRVREAAGLAPSPAPVRGRSR